MAKTPHNLNFPMALKIYRQSAQLSQEELAHKSGLDRTYISMLERGIKSPTLNTMITLCESLGITLEELTRQMSSKNSKKESPKKESPKKEIRLPLMGTKVACGVPIGDDHYVDKEISLEDLLIKHPEQTFFVQATGDSMAPSIQNNDFLVIDKSMTPKSGQIILAQIDSEFTVKRYFKEGKIIKLKADNALYPTIEIQDKQKFTFCGTLVSIIRNNP